MSSRKKKPVKETPVKIANYFAALHRRVKISSRFVGEYSHITEDARWFACLDDVNIKKIEGDRVMYQTATGNGLTPGDAIQDLVDSISGRTVTLSSHDFNVHIDIDVPQLVV